MIPEHELSEIGELAGMPFRTCEPDEEEQATSLGGTLLLARPLLVRAALRKMTPEDIADEYGTTADLARWCYNSTGVARQISARQAQ